MIIFIVYGHWTIHVIILASQKQKLIFEHYSNNKGWSTFIGGSTVYSSELPLELEIANSMIHLIHSKLYFLIEILKME